MKPKIKIYHPLIVVAMAALLVLLVGFNQKITPSPVPAPAENITEIYRSLIKYLVDGGLPNEEVIQLFEDPRVAYYENIAVNLYRPPIMDSYSSIMFHTELEEYHFADFLQQYHHILDAAESKYQVDKETIAAILYIETKLGKVMGKYSVFNVLSSLALADQTESLEKIVNHINAKYHYLSYDRRQELIEYYQNRAIRKAENARAEFLNLIQLHFKTHLDILELPGSYAGAFGYPQFMPSNVLRYGVDADNDGQINLYSFPDAIFSIANFLQNKGWNDDLERQRRALLRYNNSHRYVSDVLKTAQLFKEDGIS